MGTPSYMPPEQAAGRTDQVGPLADVYSLGAILYCLLTGRPPFQASNPLDTLMQVMEREPVSVTTLNPATPRDLETICHKCLQKDPAKRYASAQEFADDLRRWLSGEPIRARAVSSSERAWRWVKRHKSISALSAATAISILAGLAVSLNFGLKATRAQRETEKALASANFNLAIANTSFEKEEEAIRNLYSIPTPYRDLEWQLARATLASNGEICYFHDNGIHALVVSPDGTKIASTDSQQVIIFDLQTNKRVVEFEKLHGWTVIENLTFSPDSKYLAVFGDGYRTEPYNETRVIAAMWDIDTQQRIFELEGDGYLNSIAFSPNGLKLAGSRGQWDLVDSAEPSGQIWIWSTQTGELLNKISTKDIYTRICFSRDSERIYANKGRTTSIVFGKNLFQSQAFAPDSPEQIQEIDLDRKTIKPFAIHGHEITWLSDQMSSAEGEFFLSNASPYSNPFIEIIPFDASLDKMTIDRKIGTQLIQLADNGKRVFAVAKGRRILSWDLISGKQDLESKPEFSRITHMRVHPNAFQVITGHRNGAVKITGMKSMGTGFQQLNRENCDYLCVADDFSKYWGMNGDGTICAWDSITGKNISSIERVGVLSSWIGYCRFAVSKDGSKGLVASGAGFSRNNVPQGKFELWDLKAGKLMHSFQRDGQITNTKSISFTPDEKQVVCVMDDGLIRFWDIHTGDIVREFSHKALTKDMHEAKVIHFLPATDEMIISTGFEIWKGFATNWERAFKGKQSNDSLIELLESSRDGRFLATSDRNSISIYDTKSMTILCSARDFNDKLGSVVYFAFNPDGSRLVSLHGDGADIDSRLVVWETSNLSEVYRTTIPKVSVHSRLVFNETGCDFSLGTDNGLFRFNSKQGDSFVVPSVIHENSYLMFSNDEKFLKISSDDSRYSEQIFECESGGIVRGSGSEFGPQRTDIGFGFQAKSRHGKWIAVGESSREPIQLIPVSSFVSESDAKNGRGDAVIWHSEQLSLAIRNRDMASELFHLAWIFKDDPTDVSKFDELHDAYDRLLSESKTAPSLSPAVAGALNLPRANVEPPLTDEAAEQFVREAWGFTGDPQHDTALRWLLANSKLVKLRRICEQYPLPFYWDCLGAVYLRRSEPQNAIEALNRATSSVDAKHSPIIAYLLLAMAHDQLGDLDAANRYLDQVDAYPNHLQAISDTSQALYFEAYYKIRKTSEIGYAQPIADFNLEGTFDRLLSQRWLIADGIDEQSVFHRCPDKPRSGKYSMHLRPYQAEKNFVRRSIAVEPGTRYRFSVECYPSAIAEVDINQARAGKQPTVSFIIRDSDASVTHTPKVLNWEEVNLEFTTLPEQTSVTLEVKFDAQGATTHNGVWLDDFHIQKLELRP